jgi:radical SAM protein (TIGR01212 family)
LDEIVGISIATRPDCLGDEVLEAFEKLQGMFPHKFIWVELGLQTIHEKTAMYIRRGYDLACFEEAIYKLNALQIPVIVHLILGLPGETSDMILQSITYLNHFSISGIKLQLLYILKNTDLHREYMENPWKIYTLDEYCSLIIRCLELLSPDIVIHRLTGDGPKDLLEAPLWSLDKRKILNTIHKEMKLRNTYQGRG